MGTNYNPQIVTSGLVLAIDAANPKSYLYRENLILFSQGITAANGWGFGSNTTFVSSANTAPDGSNTATSIFGNGSGANIYIGRQPAAYIANTFYTASCWARLSSGSVPTGGAILTISYSTNVIGTQTRSVVGYNGNLTSSWQRFSTTYFNVAPGNYTAFFVADQNNTATIEVWGAQVQESNIVTSYVPTTGTAVQRSNTFIDITSNGNNSVLANTPPFNSANGSFTFNGGATDQYIFGTLPTIAASSNVTTEAVIKLNTIIGTKNIFTLGRSAVSFSYGMVINGSSFRFRNSSNDHIFSSPTTLTTGVWYHLILSSTATETTGYINGVSQGTTANVVTGNAITDYHISRRSSNSASEYMNGEIALIRVYYNKAFTQDEALQNFNATRGRYGI